MEPNLSAIARHGANVIERAGRDLVEDMVKLGADAPHILSLTESVVAMVIVAVAKPEHHEEVLEAFKTRVLHKVKKAVAARAAVEKAGMSVEDAAFAAVKNIDDLLEKIDEIQKGKDPIGQTRGNA